MGDLASAGRAVRVRGLSVAVLVILAVASCLLDEKAQARQGIRVYGRSLVSEEEETR